MTHLFVVAAVTGCLTTFFEVSYQSWLPQLIGTENLIEGNTKLQISRSVAEAVGAGAGGALIQLLGAARAVTADAFTFLISLIARLAIRHRDVRERTEERKASAKAEVKEGMKTLFGNPVLRGLFTANVVVNLGAAMGDAVLIVYAYKELNLMSVFVIVGAVLSDVVSKSGCAWPTCWPASTPCAGPRGTRPGTSTRTGSPRGRPPD
ncbi:MFS transporter [Streptomyces sp. NPDC059496]|uniref:MFS transporter n=1 Tax=Streptomyces sp. NPDC059496 TaxID=3346851 RepID=UPI003683A1FC